MDHRKRRDAVDHRSPYVLCTIEREGTLEIIDFPYYFFILCGVGYRSAGHRKRRDDVDHRFAIFVLHFLWGGVSFSGP